MGSYVAGTERNARWCQPLTRILIVWGVSKGEEKLSCGRNGVYLPLWLAALIIRSRGVGTLSGDFCRWAREPKYLDLFTLRHFCSTEAVPKPARNVSLGNGSQLVASATDKRTTLF
jgi:hypothetical protein